MCKLCETKEKQILAYGDYIRMIADRCSEGLYIWAVSDTDTDLYFPKYCPECGKKLK